MSINMKMRLPAAGCLSWKRVLPTRLTGLTCGNKCTRKLPTYVILVSIIYQADVLQFFLLLRPGRSQHQEPESDQDMSRSRILAHMCVDSVTVSGNCHFSVAQERAGGWQIGHTLEKGSPWLIESSGPWSCRHKCTTNWNESVNITWKLHIRLIGFESVVTDSLLSGLSDEIPNS